MKQTRNIDIEKLVETTVQFLITEGFSPIDLYGTARGENNILGRLCLKFFGQYSFKDSMYISTLWKRNQLEFQSKVNDLFWHGSSKSTSKLNSLEISLNPTEQMLLEGFIVSFRDGRKRFCSEFSNFLSNKVQEIGIKCWLQVNSNWFRKENGRKNGDFWSGKYTCIDCKNSFKMKIESKQMDKIIIDNIIHSYNHIEFIEPPKRISGEKRKLLSQEINSKGVGNFRAENFLKNNDQYIDYNKIRKISSEFTHRYRLFNEIRVDCDAIKNAFDILLPETFANGLKGFIQEVSINPFKMTLISEIQIRMWDSIQKINPVWHFDASGLFLNEINDQSKPFLFSIVTYDPNTRSLIPISDFFSTANDGLNIQLNLYRIQNIFQRYKNTYSPSIIVTDFSWANIHAILRIFHNCDVIQYLKMCYKKTILNDNTFDEILKTKIYLCSTHFLKNIIDDLNKNFSKKKLLPRIKACFIFCFTILQNSTTIMAFNDILRNFYNIFNQPKVNQSLVNSLVKVQFEIKTRNINWLKSAYQFKDRNYLEKSDDLRKEIIFKNDFSDNYRKDSPFTKYFEDQLKLFKKDISIEIKENSEKLPKNEFYFPELMTIIIKRLHLAPIWSAFVISSELKNFPKRKILNRLTNNPVEAWFGYFRNKVLRINKRIKIVKRLNPSEIVTPYYNYLMLKFNQHYKSTSINFSTTDFSNPRLKMNQEEKWSFPSFNKSEREKGFYFSNKFDLLDENVFNEAEKTISNFNDLSNILSIDVSDLEIIKEESIQRYTCFKFSGANLCFKEIYELLNNDMLSDMVIEIFMNIKSEFLNVKIFSYFHSKKIFENSSDFNFEDLSIYDKIFGLIYISKIRHWCLFFVDVKKKTFSLLDSLASKEREHFFFEKWKNFCDKREEFHGINWKTRQFQHSKQVDGTSCGVYVCMFMEKLLEIEENEGKLEVFSPSEFRKKIFNLFVDKSLIENKIFCSICSKIESKKEICKTFNCWHAYHIACLKDDPDSCPQCLKFINLYRKIKN